MREFRAVTGRPYAEAVVRQTGAVPIYCEITREATLGHLDQLLFQYEEIGDIQIGPRSGNPEGAMSGEVSAGVPVFEAIASIQASARSIPSLMA